MAKLVDPRHIHNLKKKLDVIAANSEQLLNNHDPALIKEIIEITNWMIMTIDDVFSKSKIKVDNKLNFESGVLIDDSESVAELWNLAGSKVGKSVIHFKTGHNFLHEMKNYDKKTFIYIDWYISEFQDSLALTKEIFENGFKNIFITTDANHLDIMQMPWVKEIISKNPPWSS